MAYHYPTHADAADASTSASNHKSNTLGLLTSQEVSFPVTFLPNTKMLIVDTGASISITYDLKDFTTPIHPVQPTTLKGIASGLAVKGIGSVHYQFCPTDGPPILVQLDNVLYVPGCSVRLLCPRHLAHATGMDGDGFQSYKDHANLRLFGRDIPVNYHTATGLPIVYSGATSAALSSVVNMTTHQMDPPPVATVATATPVSTLPPPGHINLSKAQQTKLLMHERCGHRNMKHISQWIRQGLLPCAPSVANCPDPVCLACQRGKAHRKPHAGATGAITAGSLGPGDGVSADQLEAGCPGRIPTTKGMPSTK